MPILRLRENEALGEGKVGIAVLEYDAAVLKGIGILGGTIGQCQIAVLVGLDQIIEIPTVGNALALDYVLIFHLTENGVQGECQTGLALNADLGSVAQNGGILEGDLTVHIHGALVGVFDYFVGQIGVLGVQRKHDGGQLIASHHVHRDGVAVGETGASVAGQYVDLLRRAVCCGTDGEEGGLCQLLTGLIVADLRIVKILRSHVAEAGGILVGSGGGAGDLTDTGTDDNCGIGGVVNGVLGYTGSHQIGEILGLQTLAAGNLCDGTNQQDGTKFHVHIVHEIFVVLHKAGVVVVGGHNVLAGLIPAAVVPGPHLCGLTLAPEVSGADNFKGGILGRVCRDELVVGVDGILVQITVRFPTLNGRSAYGGLDHHGLFTTQRVPFLAQRTGIAGAATLHIVGSAHALGAVYGADSGAGGCLLTLIGGKTGVIGAGRVGLADDQKDIQRSANGFIDRKGILDLLAHFGGDGDGIVAQGFYLHETFVVYRDSISIGGGKGEYFAVLQGIGGREGVAIVILEMEAQGGVLLKVDHVGGTLATQFHVHTGKGFRDSIGEHRLVDRYLGIRIGGCGRNAGNAGASGRQRYIVCGITGIKRQIGTVIQRQRCQLGLVCAQFIGILRRSGRVRRVCGRIGVACRRRVGSVGGASCECSGAAEEHGANEEQGKPSAVFHIVPPKM